MAIKVLSFAITGARGNMWENITGLERLIIQCTKQCFLVVVALIENGITVKCIA